MENELGHHASQEKGIPSPAQDEKDQEDGDGNVPDQRSGNASMSRLYWVILCSSMLLAELQAALDSTITADLQPTIINAFGEISKFPWINVTYSLGMGGSCLFW